MMSKPRPAAKRVLSKLKRQPTPVRRSNPAMRRPKPVAKPFRSKHMQKLQAQGKLKPRQIPRRHIPQAVKLNTNAVTYAVQKAVRLNRNQAPSAVAAAVKKAAEKAGAPPPMA